LIKYTFLIKLRKFKDYIRCLSAREADNPQYRRIVELYARRKGDPPKARAILKKRRDDAKEN
jgi:hypothetical protein